MVSSSTPRGGRGTRRAPTPRVRSRRAAAGVTIVSRRVGREVKTTNGMEQGADPATAERGARSLDRVTAADLMLIWPEKQGWPQVIGALAVLEGGSMVDTDGEFRIDAIRETVGHRLHLVPRFRQALYWPRRGLGWPVWADAQSFDIADHVRVHPVPSPWRRATTPPRLRDAAAPSTPPGPALVGDVVPDRAI